jgi:hypothetical protein
MHCDGSMREYDEEDPKQPRPVGVSRKGDNAWEAQESGNLREVGPSRSDQEQDRHRHVRV